MSELPKPDYSISKATEHVHQRTLLAAMQVARPVPVEGKASYIHTLSVQQLGGQIGMTVYLTGRADPVEPCAISLQPQPE